MRGQKAGAADRQAEHQELHDLWARPPGSWDQNAEAQTNPGLRSLGVWGSGSEPWGTSGSLFKGAAGAGLGSPGRLSPRRASVASTSRDPVGSEPELPEIRG